MRFAALSIGAIFGGVVVFTVVAPEQTRSVARSLEAVVDKTAVEGHYHHGFMGKENSAWKKVDWETVKEAKMGHFELAKKAQNTGEVRTLVLEAGVPEDHVDYFVNKWVASAQACDAKEGAEMEDCYKAAADWHQWGHHHHGAEHMAVSTSSAKPTDGGCYNAKGTHEIVCEADGADEATCGGKWVQSCSALGYACCGGKPETTSVDHSDWSAWKSVDWETVKAAKTGFFERAKSAEDVRPLAAGLRASVVKSGVPEDSVDSMVNRWTAAAEACNGKKGAEKDDCYKKAADCHGGHHGGKENWKEGAWKDIDWEKVKAAKLDYFERVKAAHNSAAGLRAVVLKAGVPEDHVDSMVTRWVASTKACDGKEGAEMEECYKKAAECPFKGKSMAEDASASEQPYNLKLLRLKRLFNAAYLRLGDLVKSVLG